MSAGADLAWICFLVGVPTAGIGLFFSVYFLAKHNGEVRRAREHADAVKAKPPASA